MVTYYMRTPADTNSTDAYLPKTTEEKAGAVGGTNAAVPADPNFVFASVMTLQAWQPYPTGGGGSGAVSTTSPVETDATLSVPNLDGGGGSSSVTINQDGLVITLTGTDLTVNQDALGNYIVRAPSGIVTVPALPTIDPAYASQVMPGGLGTATYVGNVMVDPQGMIAQGFDNRLNTQTPPSGPAQNYSAGLAATLPLAVDASAGPKTVWFYRGLDAVQNGGSYTGCCCMVQITICKDIPAGGFAANLRPTGWYVAGGKDFTPLSAINYSAAATNTLPVGAVEPDWSNIQALRRPLVQANYRYIGAAGPGWLVQPCYTQHPYPATQAEISNRVLLGAISNSASRVELINRVVMAGIDIHAQVAFGHSAFVGGGGFGHGYKDLRFAAGKFLNRPAMLSRPSQVDIGVPGYLVDYFAEDGNVFLGVPDGTWPLGKPLFGTIDSGYPSGPFALQHDARDINGIRESHWIARLTGTARAGSSNTIQLAAAVPIDTVYAGFGIYISGGPGAGQTRRIASWVEATKTATMTANWTTPPTSSSTYEYYNSEANPAGNTYQGLATYNTVGSAMAVVLAGWGAAYENNTRLTYIKRWVTNDGKLDTHHPDDYGGSAFDADIRKFGDSVGTWAAKWWPAALALWPIQGDTTGPTVSVLSPLDNATSVNTATNLVMTFNETPIAGTGNFYLHKADSTLVQTFTSGTAAVVISGLDVTLNPTSDLLPNQPYYVLRDGAAIKDAAGNFAAAVTDPTAWSFQTAGAASWHDVWTITLNSNVAQGDYNRRVACVGFTGTFTASKVRITVEAPSSGTDPTDITACSIGIRSGSTVNMTAAPVQILFAGAASKTLAPASGNFVSDEATITFSNTNTLLVHFDVGTVSQHRYTTSVGSNLSYYKTASTDYNVQSPTGYSQDLSGVFIVTKIEAFY